VSGGARGARINILDTKTGRGGAEKPGWFLPAGMSRNPLPDSLKQ